MKPQSKSETKSLNRILLLTALSIALLIATTGSAATEVSPEVQACLDCHSDQSNELQFQDGTKMSVFVDVEQFSPSMHGAKLNCTDCHNDISEYPHPERAWKNRRAFALSLYESCKRCHFANYTKTLESIHYKILAKGDLRAPVCIDCHGAHAIPRSKLTKLQVSQTCRSCHEQVYQTYSKSVHGAALLQASNTDVPVCTDCHHAHDIADPRTADFMAGTPQICGQCHANKALMKKYGLSNDVLQTYLVDFHGVSASFYKRAKQPNISSWKAVCTDCHGVHDITKVTAQNSPVLKRNLLASCRKCHPDASENFPDAWLSHYEPSPTKASLVWYVKLFYKFFIPFTIGGLVLHILLHIWRVATNR